MSNEIKEKEEYEKYARDHRKELDAQEVKLGDVVTVLIGHFAGEKGVIVGMIACDKSDFADPYYEIEMECDVPEEFRVRKTLIGQSRVIGGVEKRYLKVIGNRAPKQPSMEIKQGDKVRVREDAPRLCTDGWSCNWLDCDVYVTKIDGDAAEVKKICDDDEWYYLNIPLKYLVKVDAEAKEARFKVGDKVVRKNVSTVRTIISIDYVDDDEDPTYYYNTVDSQGNNPMDFLESELILYAESTSKYKKGDRVKICSKNAARFGCVGTILEVHDNGTVDVDFNDYYVGGHLYSVDFIEPYTEPTAPKIKIGDRVRNVKSDLCGIALKIEHGIVEVGIPYDKERHYWNTDIVELFEPTEQTEAEKTFDDQIRDVLNGKKHQDFGYPMQTAMINLNINDWDAYAADLAKEVVLKVANKFNDPEQAAEYAVKVAKAVVEGLKRK